MRRERNVEIASRMMAAHNGGPGALLAEFGELFHPDCEWVPVVVDSLEGTRYQAFGSHREANEAAERA